MKNVLIFVSGLAIGSLATWKLIETKYKKLADEEIESVISTFKEHNKETEDKQEIKKEKTKEEDDNMTLNTLYNKYSNISKIDDNVTVNVEQGATMVEPYVISPDEYGNIDNYECESWDYYSDLVLVNGLGEIVSDAEETIGDGLNHFGDYGEYDSVYVRNENLETDYEILKHEQTYYSEESEA